MQPPESISDKYTVEIGTAQGVVICNSHMAEIHAVRDGTVTFCPPRTDFWFGRPQGRDGETFPFVYRGMGLKPEGLRTFPRVKPLQLKPAVMPEQHGRPL